MPDPVKRGESFLTRKVGPLPMWAWLSLGLVLGYFLFFRGKGASLTGSQQPSASTSSSTPDSSTPAIPASAGSAGDTSGLAAGGVSAADLLSTLGAQNQSLQAALLQQEQDVIGLAEAQMAQATSAGAVGALVSTPTTSVVSSQPGTPNTPTLAHVAPFGGIIGSRTTAKGVKITTYASGRVVEQAPGKKAYVAKAGGHPVAKAAPPRKPPPKPAKRR